MTRAFLSSFSIVAVLVANAPAGAQSGLRSDGELVQAPPAPTGSRKSGSIVIYDYESIPPRKSPSSKTVVRGWDPVGKPPSSQDTEQFGRVKTKFPWIAK